MFPPPTTMSVSNPTGQPNAGIEDVFANLVHRRLRRDVELELDAVVALHAADDDVADAGQHERLRREHRRDAVTQAEVIIENQVTDFMRWLRPMISPSRFWCASRF